MNIRIIRNLFFFAVLAIAINCNLQHERISTTPARPTQSTVTATNADDLVIGEAHKFHCPASEFQSEDLSRLTAPVQESIASVRRIEYSRSSESLDTFRPAGIVLTPSYRLLTVAINDRHCNSALCHNSRFYINKFGTLLI